MFSVIRIPTKFSKTIKRLSDKEKVQLFSMLMDIGDGIKVKSPDSMVGDILSLIYGEWMNMESRNGNKPEESLIEYTSELPGTVSTSDTEHRIEYSRVEENRIDTSSEVISKDIIYISDETDSTLTISDLVLKTMKENPIEVGLSIFENQNKELADAIRNFLEFRKELKKPIKDSSFPMWCKKLKQLSGSDSKTAIRILENSIANGWQGIFPVEPEIVGKQRGVRTITV